MTLLLDEIALATARLAEAGVDSPRADAEIIAAHVHNVKRSELHAVPDSEFDARFWADIGRREGIRLAQFAHGNVLRRPLAHSRERPQLGNGLFEASAGTEDQRIGDDSRRQRG